MPRVFASICVDCLLDIGVDLFAEESITGTPTLLRSFSMVARRSGVFKKSDVSVIMFVETPKAYDSRSALFKEALHGYLLQFVSVMIPSHFWLDFLELF